MNRKSWTILLAAVLVFALSGCGSSDGKESASNSGADSTASAAAGANGSSLEGQTITVYSTHVDTENWDKLVQAFEEKTGIQVKSVKSPSDYSANVQKLTVSLSSGDDEYDVIYIDELMAMNFQSAGFLSPFTEEAFPAEVRANYNEDALNSFSLKDGQYYTLPSQSSAMLLFANKKLFEEANVAIPTNAEQFLEAAKKLTKADGSQYGYGAAWSKGGQLFNDAIRWVTAYGGDYNDWTNPNTQQAFQAMHDFIYKDQIMPKSAMGDAYDALNNGFIDGKYAMIYNWNDFSAQMGDAFGDNLVVIPNIQFATNKTIGSSWFYAINRNSRQIEAANAFIQWLASVEGQTKLVELPTRSAGHKQVLQQSEQQINKDLFQYMDANAVATRPLTENVNEVMDQTETVLSKYLTDQITLEQAVADGQKILDMLIQ